MAASVELPPPPAPSIQTKHVHNCPECGTSIQLDTGEVEMARRKIVELEAQMEFLKEKATAAGMLLQMRQQVHGAEGLTYDSGQMRRLRGPNTKSPTQARTRSPSAVQHIRRARNLKTIKRRASPCHRWRTSFETISIFLLDWPPHITQQLDLPTTSQPVLSTYRHGAAQRARTRARTPRQSRRTGRKGGLGD